MNEKKEIKNRKAKMSAMTMEDVDFQKHSAEIAKPLLFHNKYRHRDAGKMVNLQFLFVGTDIPDI